MADQAGIQLDPERVSFSSTKTSAKVKISNKFSEHVIIKVKCTSNELFSIRPPVFGMDEGDVSSVNLSCKDVAALEKDKDGHYFMVYYLRAEKEEKKTIRQILAERKGAGQGEFDGKQKIPVGMSGSCEVDKKAKSNENGNGNGKKMAGEARKQSTEDAAKKAAAEEKKKDEKMGEDKKKDEKTAEGTTKKEGSCKKTPKNNARREKNDLMPKITSEHKNRITACHPLVRRRVISPPSSRLLSPLDFGVVRVSSILCALTISPAENRRRKDVRHQ